jgi:hypothetical protein
MTISGTPLLYTTKTWTICVTLAHRFGDSMMLYLLQGVMFEILQHSLQQLSVNHRQDVNFNIFIGYQRILVIKQKHNL